MQKSAHKNQRNERVAATRENSRLALSGARLSHAFLQGLHFTFRAPRAGTSGEWEVEAWPPTTPRASCNTPPLSLPFFLFSRKSREICGATDRMHARSKIMLWLAWACHHATGKKKLFLEEYEYMPDLNNKRLNIFFSSFMFEINSTRRSDG